MRTSKNIGVALVGLLVVAAISVAAGSGKKPAKEQQAAISLRQISGSEVIAMLDQFPEMLPSCFAEQKNDTGFLKTLFPFSEVTSASLVRAFPGVRFYKGTDFGRTEGGGPYVMAIANGKRYAMPGKFNHLLLDGGLKVTDKNIVALAEAFVVLAVGSERRSYPDITFLRATTTKQMIGGRSYSAKLTVRVGKQTEEWYSAISARQGQFGTIYRRGAKGFIKRYLPVVLESLPGRGQVDLPTPSMVIDTFPTGGDAYVEYDSSSAPHYYVVVERNDDSTGNEIVFSLGIPGTQ